MLIPFFDVPTFTDEQTRSLNFIASGIELMSARSAAVIPLCTSAEKPPTKSTSSSFAILSSSSAHSVKSASPLAPATRAIGVTAIRLLIIGTPNSVSISRPTGTRRDAYFIILSYILRRLFLPSSHAQSKRFMPSVIARISSFCRINIFTVS